MHRDPEFGHELKRNPLSEGFIWAMVVVALLGASLLHWLILANAVARWR
jgi:hypothetical protein